MMEIILIISAALLFTAVYFARQNKKLKDELNVQETINNSVREENGRLKFKVEELEDKLFSKPKPKRTYKKRKTTPKK